MGGATITQDIADTIHTYVKTAHLSKQQGLEDMERRETQHAINEVCVDSIHTYYVCNVVSGLSVELFISQCRYFASVKPI